MLTWPPGGPWREQIVWALAAADILLAALVLFAFLGPRTATFTIDANVEIVSFDVAVGSPAATLRELKVDSVATNNLGNDARTPACEDLKLGIDEASAAQAHFVAQTNGEDRRLLVKAGQGASLGTYICGDDATPAPSHVSLKLGPATRLVFSGPVTVGALPLEGASEARILKKGSIKVSTVAAPFPTGIATQSVDLSPGDRVQLFDKHGRLAPSHVLIFPDEGGLKVVAHGQGAEARILRAGLDSERSIVVAPTIWSRLQAQLEWPLIVLFGGLLLHFLGVVKDLVPKAPRSPPAQGDAMASVNDDDTD